jgi:hypothetical protein
MNHASMIKDAVPAVESFLRMKEGAEGLIVI